MVLERVRPSIRGELSRWLIEPQAGVFVGDVSAVVRDSLWQKCLRSLGNGSVVQIWSSNSEQGFAMRSAGSAARRLSDHDGLVLVCMRRGERNTHKQTEVAPLGSWTSGRSVVSGATCV